MDIINTLEPKNGAECLEEILEENILTSVTYLCDNIEVITELFLKDDVNVANLSTGDIGTIDYFEQFVTDIVDWKIVKEIEVR